MTDNNLLLNLPQEVITDILLLLPVKSLSRFKCISKTWLSLLSSPVFIKSHLQISSKSVRKNANPTIILGYTEKIPVITFYTCSLNPLVHDKRLEDVKSIQLDFNFDLEKSDFELFIIGSVNGLVCFQTRHELSLWNPCTGKSKQLPYPGTLRNRMGFYGRVEEYGERVNILYVSFGFAYDEFNDDFKVVELQHVYGNKLVVRVYSLRTNSWKEIQECDAPGHVIPQRSVFLERNLHWVCKRDRGNKKRKDSWTVLSYNLENELLGNVVLPPSGDVSSAEAVILGTLRGCLCLILFFKTSTSIWTMKEYGVEESWMKVLSFPESMEYLWSKTYVVTGLDAFEESGFLLSVEESLTSLNLLDGKYADFEYFHYPGFQVRGDVIEFRNTVHRSPSSRDNGNRKVVLIEAAPYIESLVSPLSYGDQAN